MTCNLFSWNLCIYFPIISNSILRVSSTPSFARLVQSCVRGMSDTVRLPVSRDTTVRLTPFTAMLPFCITLWSYREWYETQSMRDPSACFSRSMTFHTVSICPLTKCPSIRSPIWRHRSILKKSPTFLEAKFVTLKLSCIVKNS